MTMKVNVGVTRKVGLPNFGSAGASCNIDVELDQSLLAGDRQALHQRVQSVLEVCRRVVADELALQTQRETAGQWQTGMTLQGPPACEGVANPPVETSFREALPDSRGNRSRSGESAPRPATPGQIKALHAISKGLGLTLSAELHREYGVHSPQQLTLAQASAMIDRLKATSMPQPA